MLTVFLRDLNSALQFYLKDNAVCLTISTAGARNMTIKSTCDLSCDDYAFFFDDIVML